MYREEPKRLQQKYQKMSLQEMYAEYEKLLKLELQGQIDNIQQIAVKTIERSINSILLNAIGMELDWDNRWQVDHCNGRRGAIVEEIGRLAMEQVKLNMPDFVERLCAAESTMAKSITKAVREEYKERYAYALREALLQRARSRAEKDAEAMLNKALAPKDKDPLEGATLEEP